MTFLLHPWHRLASLATAALFIFIQTLKVTLFLGMINIYIFPLFALLGKCLSCHAFSLALYVVSIFFFHTLWLLRGEVRTGEKRTFTLSGSGLNCATHQSVASLNSLGQCIRPSSQRRQRQMRHLQYQ